MVSTIDAKTGEVRQLASFGDLPTGQAVWMPEGKALIVSVAKIGAGRRLRLWTVDYPSGEKHRFTSDLADYDSNLDLSSDGKMLSAVQVSRASTVWAASAANLDEAHETQSSQTPYRFMVARADGKLLAIDSKANLRLADPSNGETSVLARDMTPNTTLRLCGDKYLVYDRVHDGKVEIWRTDQDGSHPVQMYTDSIFTACSQDGAWLYLWPSGDTIYRMPMTGGNPEAVAKIPTEDIGGLDVSPDGSLLAVGYQPHDTAPSPSQLLGVVSSTPGGDFRVVSKLPFSAYELRWAPYGNAIQYGLIRNGAGNVWEQPIAGGDPRQVTHFTSKSLFNYSWSPDHKTLYVERGSDSRDVVLMTNFRQ